MIPSGVHGARVTHALCDAATAAELDQRGALQPQECGETAARTAAHLAATRGRGKHAWPFLWTVDGDHVKENLPPTPRGDDGVGSRCGICGEVIVKHVLRVFVPLVSMEAT